jgi:hypothetical protein
MASRSVEKKAEVNKKQREISRKSRDSWSNKKKAENKEHQKECRDREPNGSRGGASDTNQGACSD